MIRMIIEWDFISPLLQVVSGILTVEDINFVGYKAGGSTDNKLLFKCRVKKEKGSTGYASLDKEDESKGIPTDLFEVLKPTIDTMVNSYFHGMLLSKMDFQWIEDSLNNSFEEWAMKNGLDPSKY